MLLFLYISTLLHIVLAIYVFLKNHRNYIHIYFSLFAIFIASWSYSNIAFLNSPNEEVMEFWTAIAYNAGSLMIFFMYNFSLSLVSKKERKSIKFVHIALLISSLLIVYIPNFVFTGVNFSLKSINTNYGVIILFLSYLYFIVLALKTLKSRLNDVSGSLKIQLRIIFWGLLLAIIFGLTFNVILPSLKNYTYVNLGPSFSLILLSVITYNILKYQLFDIRLVFGKISYYILSSIPPYFMYFILAYIYETVFDTSLNKYAFVIGVPVAILFTVFSNIFIKYISEYTDSHLINPGYNPLVVLEQLRQRLTTSLDIEKISQESLFMISRTIRPDTSGVIIMTNNQTNELLSFNYKKEPYTSSQDFNMFLQFFISKNIKTITANDLKDPQQYSSLDRMLKSHILSQMEKYELEVMIALKEEQKVRGLLLVGYKEAKAPYNSQELKLLISIAETMSLGIGRALLYKEIQQFNETLQKKVKDATAQLQQKNKALEEALLKLEEVRRQEKDMLDVMGHELRTPISIARNSVVTLQKHISKNDINPEKLTKYTKMAVESIRREIALIETFLSTTKLEGGRMQVNSEKVSLKDVIHESLEGHNDLSKRNNTKVIYTEPENDIFVIADKIRIQEVMDNFLNNAIKYTGEGNVEIKMYEQESLGWIDVKDDGIGISSENLQKLGRKFFRAQTLYNQSNNVVNPSGTGLGLFVSFQLIELMHGKKKITSQEGQGSTFSFGLPLFSE